MLKRLTALVAVILLVFGLAACGSDSDDDDDDASDDTTTSAPESGESSEPEPAAEGTCEYVPSGEASRPVEPPPVEPVTTTKVNAQIETSEGDIDIILNGDTAPCAVNSFISLAEQDFYDDSPCHRITTVPEFELLQCGDPDGTGLGGPGYVFAEELSGDETYPAGTLAMAKTPAPATTGSQFFLVYGDTGLPPQYTVLGTVDESDLAILRSVAEAGSTPPQDGAPNQPISVEEIDIDD